MSIETSRPSVEEPAAAKLFSQTSVWMAICCLTIILALVVGVGVASNLVLRHIVQTLPLWFVVALGFKRSPATSWFGLPVLLFWLILMGLIWSYLLGFSHILSGQFSPIEIAMTIIVGAASMGGIVSFTRSKSSLSPLLKGSAFVLLALVQWMCFRISFLPAIAHR